MAHFAKIENGTVTNVVVVENKHEANGQDYLNSIGLEGTWIQTSYTSSIRVKFAGIGDLYNAKKDRFEPAKPYQSWTWDESKYSWEPPSQPGNDQNYVWDEASTSWVSGSTE